MKIFVAGAAGQVGRIVVEKAVAAGHEVTGLVRSQEQREEIEGLGASAALSDLRDRAGLEEAIAGHDAVLFAAGSRGKALNEVDLGGAINTCDAMKATGVSRLVLLSSIFADQPEKWPSDLGPYMKAKHEADGYVKSSGLDWTLVRPGTLTDDPGTGSVKVAEELSGEIDQLRITRADVAAVIVAALTEPRTVGKAFELVEGDVEIEEALKGV